jgi:hypothetical protein
VNFTFHGRAVVQSDSRADAR